jgi:glycosyltransferase involved in cell wall biosynthesis
MNKTIVINAVNLGSFLDGIGVYTLTLLKELARMPTGLRFIVYANASGAVHLNDISFPSAWKLRWVSKRCSPDLGFKGHVFRLLYSQWIGVRHWRSPVFSTSQLEAILFRRNQMIMIHDLIPLLFKQCHQRQYYYFRYVLKFILKRVKAVITPSQHTKGLLLHHLGLNSDRVRVIPNGINPSLTANAGNGYRVTPRDGDKPYVLFTGRIVRMKNITGMLRAFAMIKDKIPHTLIIAGSGRKDVTQEFERSRLASYGIEEHRVVFKGHVTTQEMHDLMKKAAVLVFPSFYEGFGMPPLEAMACGCPVVVSNVASLPEVCGDAACYVDPYVVEDIARGILSVLTDNAKRKKLIERGYQRVREFTAAASALKHLALFGEVFGTEVLEEKFPIGVRIPILRHAEAFVPQPMASAANKVQ